MTVNRSIKSEGAAQEQGLIVYYSHKSLATCMCYNYLKDELG